MTAGQLFYEVLTPQVQTGRLSPAEASAKWLAQGPGLTDWTEFYGRLGTGLTEFTGIARTAPRNTNLGGAAPVSDAMILARANKPPAIPQDLTLHSEEAPQMASAFLMGSGGAPGPAPNFITDAIGFIGDVATGNIGGAIGDVAGWFGAGGGGGGGGGGGHGPSGCPAGYFRLGDKCVSPGDAWPGGNPLVTDANPPASGTGVQGDALSEILGTSGRAPITTQRRTCGPGWVLGMNGRCYPKGFLPAKWRESKPRRAVVSYSEGQAIKKGRSAERKIAAYASRNGIGSTSTKRRPRGHKAGCGCAICRR